MKNFLIELFRPLDTLIFNHLVRIGGIQCFLKGLIGGALSTFGGPVGAIAGSLIGGGGSRGGGSQGVASGTNQMIDRAVAAQRTPEEIIRGTYGPEGFLGQDIQDLIIGRERALLPQYSDLQKERAFGQTLGQGGTFDLGEQSRLRELGFMGQYGQQARDLFEDPRLRAIAEADLAEANRLTQEAQGPLGFEAGREAEQAAARFGVNRGTEFNPSMIARAALGRQDAVQARQDQAAAARRNALISAGQASVNPFGFLGGQSGIADAMNTAFLSQQLGPQITDPGQAINTGMGLDTNLANIMLGKGAISSVGNASSNAILANQATQGSNILSSFADAGGFTGDPNTSIFDNLFKKKSNLGISDLANTRQSQLGGGMYS